MLKYAQTALGKKHKKIHDGACLWRRGLGGTFHYFYSFKCLSCVYFTRINNNNNLAALVGSGWSPLRDSRKLEKGRILGLMLRAYVLIWTPRWKTPK